MSADRPAEPPDGADGTLLQKPVDRRERAGPAAGRRWPPARRQLGACAPLSAATAEEREVKLLAWRGVHQGHYRRMTEEERAETIARLERLAKLRRNEDVHHRHHRRAAGRALRLRLQHLEVQGIPALRRSVHQREQSRPACRTRSTSGSSRWRMAWSISTKPMPTFQHEVPAEGHFYLGTQCFQCANPPCVKVCPVGATWQEPDGIMVIDYNWCIGCRVLHGRLPVLGPALQLERARGAARGGEPQPALPGQSRPQEGVRREVHLLHPSHPAGPAAGLRRGLSDGRPGLRQPAGSRLRDPLGAREQARLPAEGRAGDGAALLVLHRTEATVHLRALPR